MSRTRLATRLFVLSLKVDLGESSRIRVPASQKVGARFELKKFTFGATSRYAQAHVCAGSNLLTSFRICNVRTRSHTRPSIA